MASSDNLASIPKLREAMQNTVSIDEKNVCVFFKLKNPSKNVFICSIAILTEEHSSCSFVISKKSSTWLKWFIRNETLLFNLTERGIGMYYLLWDCVNPVQDWGTTPTPPQGGLVGGGRWVCCVLCFNSITSSITQLSIDGVSCSQPSPGL